MVSIPSGMARAPVLAMKARSLSMSMFPLKGWWLVGSLPSSMTRSTATAPRASMLALVVSKCMLLGTHSPGPTKIEKSTFSAARPWCVGTKWRKPKIS